MKLEKHDKEISIRVAQFRLKYVGKTQQEGADKLGIGQATLNRLENGVAPLSMEVLSILILKYSLSVKWIMTGEGRMQDKTEPPKTTVTDVTAIKGHVQLLNKQFTALQYNYTFTVNVMNKKIQRQNERIEMLEEQLREVTQTHH